MAFYNIASETTTNTDLVITITECDGTGTSTPAANYSFALYRNPTIRYIPATTAAAARFQVVSQDGEKSPNLTMTNVIKLDGTAHGQATTVALATAIKVLLVS
jgi:hypothetical protein